MDQLFLGFFCFFLRRYSMETGEQVGHDYVNGGAIFFAKFSPGGKTQKTKKNFISLV